MEGSVDGCEKDGKRNYEKKSVKPGIPGLKLVLYIFLNLDQNANIQHVPTEGTRLKTVPI